VFGIVGDGGLAMQLGEFSTAVRYGSPLKLLMIKNNMLNRIAWEQMILQSAIRLRAAADRFRQGSGSHGGRGFRISTLEDIDRVLGEAFAAPEATIIEAVVDAYEPLFPPKMPPDYAENFKHALPETPGHESIEAAVFDEPLRTMMKAE
jgi:pyruvate dehydrogenase (quinone)